MTNGKSTQVESLAGIPVVVTGAGGFLGSRLIERLLKQGSTVLALDRNNSRLASVLSDNSFQYQECDLNNTNRLTDLVTDFNPKIVYHLACHPDGQENFNQIKSSISQNLMLTINTIEAFSKCSNRELFIFGDSTKVYGNSEVPYRASMAACPLSSYAIGKHAGWLYCELYQRIFETRAVSIRPTITYGPSQAFNVVTYIIESVLSRKDVIELAGGDQTRDLVYIDDCISAYVAVARNRDKMAGKIINLGGNHEISIRELAELIVKLMGRTIPVICNETTKRPTEINRVFCDNIEAENLLGWRPVVDLESGLRKTIEHIANQQKE